MVIDFEKRQLFQDLKHWAYYDVARLVENIR